MTVPYISGSEVGTALTRRIQEGMQQRQNISQTRLDNRSKRLQIEEYILDSQRRKAERSYQTKLSGSRERLLPSGEAKTRMENTEFLENQDVRKTKSVLDKMKNQEESSPEAQAGRELEREDKRLETYGNILSRANPDNWQQILKILGPAGKNLPKVFNKKTAPLIYGEINAVKNTLDHRRAVQVKGTAPKTAPKAMPLKTVTMNVPDGKGGWTKRQGYVDTDPNSPNGFLNSEKVPEVLPKGSFASTTGSTEEDDPNKPTTKILGNLQNTIISAERQLEDLSVLEAKYDEEFSTFGGELKGFFGRFFAKAGLPGELMDRAQMEAVTYVTQGTKNTFFKGRDVSWLQDGESWVDYRVRHTSAVQVINQIFHQYRKNITGAQASFMEIQQLRKSVLNDELSGPEVRQSIQDMIANLSRRVARTKELMHEGIGIRNTWSEKQGRYIQEEFALPATYTNAILDMPDIGKVHVTRPK